MAASKNQAYDHPKYYDVAFGSSSREEADFFEACIKAHAKRRIRRVFEPACGTGRMLLEFAQRGYSVIGTDTNPNAVAYCNARLVRRGFRPAARVGDMTEVRLPGKLDAAFNPVNSFRHLLTESAAETHLMSVAECLRPGGIYVLGVHLIPRTPDRMLTEKWEARRGKLSVTARVWSKGVDSRKRLETCGISYHIRTPKLTRRIRSELVLRTYSARQMKNLLKKIHKLELVATHDFDYEIDATSPITPETEDVMLVLRRR